MPYLGDYIGHLMSEMTMARMQADLESIRVAELYASHPLLRTMPIPHIRMPEVDMDLPIVISGIDETQFGEGRRGGVKLGKLRIAFEDVLQDLIHDYEIRLKHERQQQLKIAIDRRLERLDLPAEITGDVLHIADALTKATVRFFAQVVPRMPVPESRRERHAMTFEAALRKEARVAFVKLRSAPPRLHVRVTTKDIREAGPTEIITRLRLKLSEQGLEWTITDPDGDTPDRLVPE